MAVALASLALAVVCQAAVIAYWGGRMHQSVKSLIEEMPALRSWTQEMGVIQHRINNSEAELSRAREARRDIYRTVEEIKASIRDLEEVTRQGGEP